MVPVAGGGGGGVNPEMARQRHDEGTAESGDGTTEGRGTERHDEETDRET